MQYKGELKYPATVITTQWCKQTCASVRIPPSLGSSGEPIHPLFDFVFSLGEASVRSAQTLAQGSRNVPTELGNTPTRHTPTENVLVKTYMQGVNHQ